MSMIGFRRFAKGSTISALRFAAAIPSAVWTQALIALMRSAVWTSALGLVAALALIEEPAYHDALAIEVVNP